nr:uncharacterized protein LOC113696591 [Coffea arabica]
MASKNIESIPLHPAHAVSVTDVSPVPISSEHENHLIDVPIYTNASEATSSFHHQSLDALLPSSSFVPSPSSCFPLPAPQFPHVLDNLSTSAISHIDPSPIRRRKNTPLLQQIPLEPTILPSVPDCPHCHAKRFYMEPPRFCCASGEVCLAETKMLDKLLQLYKGNTPESIEFRQCIRSYNNMFAFTSLGVHYDKELSKRNRGIYTFRVQGQIYHFVNPLKPSTGEKASNLQLYFYDTEHEMQNRMALSSKFKESIVQQLKSVLDDNPYSIFIRKLADIDKYKIFLKSNPGLDQRVFNVPSMSQVAAIWSENDSVNGDRSREIEILSTDICSWRNRMASGILRKTKTQILQQPYQTCEKENLVSINECNDIEQLFSAEQTAAKKKKRQRPTVSCREYYAYKFQMRDGDQSNLLHIDRLFQQYSVDSYVKLETSRLEFHRNKQNKLRTEAYQGLLDIIAKGNTNASDVGKRIILPASFIGGSRDMRRRYMDAMTLVQHYGKLDIFLTMTCNPSWPEIKNHLLDTDEAQNRPDLITRIFRAKIEQLKEDLFKKHLFGHVAAYTYVIEFQKRGFLHAHFLIILKEQSKMFSPEEYDKIVCAELSDRHKAPYLYSLVIKHMLHGPCGSMNPSNPCMKQNHKCRNNYPKDFSEYTKHEKNSYPIYRRRDDGSKIYIREHELDNRWIVPYNPYLLAKYDCHINVEIYSAIEAVKYIYKYIYKGHDRVMYQLTAEQANQIIDEIKNFQSARWVCAPEAIWRIYAFDLSVINPSVILLHLHLENYQSMYFDENRPLTDIITDDRLSRTMLTEFFAMNRTNEHAESLNLLYKEFPQHFVWDADDRIWYTRKKGQVIGRVITAHPIEGERYYLRILLMHVRKPTSFDDLKTVNGYLASSFKEAAELRGFLQIDNGAEECFSEAVVYGMPQCLRQLFAVILVHCSPADLQQLWSRFRPFLSEDITADSSLSENEIIMKVLALIDQYLQIMGKSIKDYGFSDFIPDSRSISLTKEIQAEADIPVSKEDLAAVSISKGDIALATATSGAAASILSGGHTAHSRFKIPLHHEASSTCNLSKQSAMSQLIKSAKLIIWDEAAMAKKYAIESLDRFLRDLLSCDHIFGGKIIVFGGDFRQTLPVVREGQKEDYISASLINSYVWPQLQKIRLTENMRASLDPSFSNLLLNIGDGTQPTIADDKIQLPSPMTIPFINDEVSLNSLINIVYPSLSNFLPGNSTMINRVILSTTNDIVHEVNQILIQKFPGEEIKYISFDQTIDPTKQADHGDFLNIVHPPGLPPHELILKQNCPVILLRNLNPAQGLCNGTRLICLNFNKNVIHAQISVGIHSGKQVFIPRIPLHSSNDESYPIPFKRTQFPISLCFAMTINKTQGQTLDFVGLYLKEPVFSHGQLYVALSRAKTADNVKILLRPVASDSLSHNSTRNVVYQEILAAATHD